jgi:hypothetical protein
VLLTGEIGLPLSRLPTLLGFATFWLATKVRVGRGSGVASSGSGVRHRPLAEPSLNRRSFPTGALREVPLGGTSLIRVSCPPTNSQIHITVGIVKCRAI